MDIAEIRKKAKKKKVETEEIHKPEVKLHFEKEEISPEQLPVVPEPDERPIIDSEIELVDEDRLYKKLEKKESAQEEEYLCFKLGDEEYCLEIRYASEITKQKDVTDVPKASDFILGVFSIRGEVIPLFDIKKLLDIEQHIISVKPRFIIVNFNGDKVGICVDEITMIRKIPPGLLEQTPINIQGAKKEFIKGIAIVGGSTLRIIDIEKVLSF